AENATALFRLGPVAELFAGRRKDVDTLEVHRVALDAGETESQLLWHEGLETPAIAVGRVLVVVVSPGERPVVAALGLADDRFLGCPGDVRNGLARWGRGGPLPLGSWGEGVIGHRVDERLEQDLHALVVKGFKHVLGVLWFRRQRFAVADHDQ